MSRLRSGSGPRGPEPYDDIWQVRGALRLLDTVRRVGELARPEAGRAKCVGRELIVGVCVAAFIASFEVQSTAITIAATLLYCVGIGAVVGYSARRRGVQPSMSSWTPELKKEFVYYLVGATVVAGSVVGLGFLINFYVAAVVGFFAVTIGGIWYHKRWRNVVSEMVAA